MKIGELAERTGLTPSRIRFYERIGLLTAVGRQPNGYRVYSPDAVVLLGLVATAQKAGFSLDEIRMLLPPDLRQWQRGALLEALRHKVRDIEAMQIKLAQNKAHLVSLMAEIEGKPDEIDCSANAARLLSQMQSREPDGAARTHGTVKAARRRPTGKG
ncbi:MerR family transcriptional regulator [Burkholderia multivorans]|uniref:MerR family transcriptional regulator n=1 Tax=Burkholderia multivorans TaxID=87883 RepID=UPI000CFF6D80|nr:MerR family transcriptional regulator [Burkholderia multivorans]MBU9487968.1 MerR family transcriptional regulator [Burkholderia multivorans]MDR8874821.1 Mercuric resistance operon regulatory protein [Burkholderia multivorans]MDR8881487.1 Mercuric resistance operon regulatory protein [Burkholderia multivorans]MDR8888582.1 Mercuric resistance operon regulatory protein [Burkholderia multivorans]MDR8893147.1 Mercuric resistance operon regulatory protein [Burkholderia multivorans]